MFKSRRSRSRAPLARRSVALGALFVAAAVGACSGEPSEGKSAAVGGKGSAVGASPTCGKAGRTGETRCCTSKTCGVGAYCNNACDRSASCSVGCTTDENCGESSYCDKCPGMETGQCQSCETPSVCGPPPEGGTPPADRCVRSNDLDRTCQFFEDPPAGYVCPPSASPPKGCRARPNSRDGEFCCPE